MSERTEVQEPILRYASEIGWTRLSRDAELGLRGGEAGLFLGELLRSQLSRLNPGVMFDPYAYQNRLENVRAGNEGKYETLLQELMTGRVRVLEGQRE